MPGRLASSHQDCPFLDCPSWHLYGHRLRALVASQQWSCWAKHSIAYPGKARRLPDRQTVLTFGLKSLLLGPHRIYNVIMFVAWYVSLVLLLSLTSKSSSSSISVLVLWGLLGFVCCFSSFFLLLSSGPLALCRWWLPFRPCWCEPPPQCPFLMLINGSHRRVSEEGDSPRGVGLVLLGLLCNHQGHKQDNHLPHY